MSTAFTFSIKRIRFDEHYRPAENTRTTTNFANLARGQRRQENLRNTLAWLPTARALVTVKSDCDLTGHVDSLDALAIRGEDSERLRELFTRYEFKSWLKDIGEPPPEAGGNAPLDAEAALLQERQQLVLLYQRSD